MKIRILKPVSASANIYGSETRFLPKGSVHESTEPWELDLFTRLVDAGMAREDKAIDAVPETGAAVRQPRRRARSK